jgi:hypothetical protein
MFAPDAAAADDDDLLCTAASLVVAATIIFVCFTNFTREEIQLYATVCFAA